MKTALLVSLLAFVVVPGSAFAASPPVELATAEPLGVHDADTVVALRDLGRAQLRVEAAAELTSLATQALTTASAVQAPERAALSGWLSECKRLRHTLEQHGAEGGAVVEGVRKHHAALQQAFSHWQLGAHNHIAAIEELMQHVSAASEAEVRAQDGVKSAEQALRTLLTLHRRAVAGYKRIDNALREGQEEVEALAQRVAREQQQCVRPAASSHSQARCRAAVDAAASQLRAAEVELASTQSKLEVALDLEQQRRIAFEHGQQLVETAQRVVEQAQADCAQIAELSLGRAMSRLLRSRDRLKVEQSSLQDELNSIRELLSAYEPLIGSAAADAPLAINADVVSTTVTALPAMGAKGHSLDNVDVKLADTQGLVETQAVLPPEQDAQAVQAVQRKRLRHSDYRRAKKPAGELLKGGAAGGLADRAMLNTPGLLHAVRTLVPHFGERDVAFSGRNRVFWLADGRQILLLNVCRSSECGQRAHVIAYDQMKEHAVLIRRHGGKLELVGEADDQLRALLLWYYGLRQRHLNGPTLASR